MRVTEIITELRRNPEQNARTSGVDAVLDYLNRLSPEQLQHTGVSMTELPKLGINPKSGYDTPLGVYFYPASYWKGRKEAGRPLPFQDKAPYIQLMSFSGNILDLGTVTQDVFDALIERLRPLADRLGLPDGKIDQLVAEAPNSANENTLPGWLWYVMYRMVSYAGGKRSIAWNKLLRDLGYNAVIDPGFGIIHPSERTQGFVVSPRDMQHLGTYDNPAREIPRRSDPVVGKALANKHAPDFIDKAIAAVNTNDNLALGTSTMKKVALHLYQALKANPSEWSKIYSLNIASSLSKLLPADDQFDVWTAYVNNRWPASRDDLAYDLELLQSKAQKYISAGVQSPPNITGAMRTYVERWKGYVSLAHQTPEVKAISVELNKYNATLDHIEKQLADANNAQSDALLKDLGV